MEGRYPPGILIALTDCTETAKETKYNQYHNEVWIPNMESLGYIRNTRRYENVLTDSLILHYMRRRWTLWRPAKNW